jgi:hypothetical protein
VADPPIAKPGVSLQDSTLVIYLVGGHRRPVSTWEGEKEFVERAEGRERYRNKDLTVQLGRQMRKSGNAAVCPQYRCLMNSQEEIRRNLKGNFGLENLKINYVLRNAYISSKRIIRYKRASCFTNTDIVEMNK